MKQFSHLLEQLEAAHHDAGKTYLLERYFERVSSAEIVWMLALLTGRRPKRLVSSAQLKSLALRSCKIPSWLFEQSLEMSGDLAEVAALLTETMKSDSGRGLDQWMTACSAVIGQDTDAVLQFITASWKEMGISEKYVFNKLITGRFRTLMPKTLLVKALSGHSGAEEYILMYRLSGHWTPEACRLEDLITCDPGLALTIRPYSFFKGGALEGRPPELGNPGNWTAEYFLPGVRMQLIRRRGDIFLWLDTGEFVNDKFPELEALINVIPDGTVLDGLMVALQEGRPSGEDLYQKRINRSRITKKTIEGSPVTFFAFDLLELDAVDIHGEPSELRRMKLERLLKDHLHPSLALSETIEFETWEELDDHQKIARKEGMKGLVLKSKEVGYGIGRAECRWEKWKVEPLSIHAVLLYVAGAGGHSGYSQFTMAVRNGDEWVPVGKVENNLASEEAREVDEFIKAHLVERFGPVRSVSPELVFEVSFEGLGASSRHKAGLVLQSPQLKGWIKDGSVEDAHSLDDLKAMLLPVN